MTITSQNHGFEVDPVSVPADAGWEVRLVNLNDGSVEGLAHRDLPALRFSFIPSPPRDRWTTSISSTPSWTSCVAARAAGRMNVPVTASIESVLVLGSGPIVIGQAAEFDYAGTQACRALREEGIRTILVNSNPATIMTDEGVADAVYIEPLTPEVVKRVIQRERPTGSSRLWGVRPDLTWRFRSPTGACWNGTAFACWARRFPPSSRRKTGRCFGTS